MKSLGIRLALMLALAACSTSPPPPASAQSSPPALGQSFVLRAGDSVALSDAKVRVRFESVLEDSRCPQGKQCAWAGNARVLLQVAVDGGKETAIELNTGKGNRKAAVGHFDVALEKVEPANTMPHAIAPGDYRVTILVR